jgi:DsbC/DsbD-like thiol-disulfide interchange protein/cytochrome c biogenesis protein CcdA
VKLNSRWVALALLSTLLLPAGAQAQIKAVLAAADRSVQPGRPFHVALRLEHQPHWHTYWINPGTGRPTRLEWQLPAGWSAGPIAWPTPIRIQDVRGNVSGYGYSGLLLLPVTLVAPANAKAGTDVTLRARTEWLMCADVCVPGHADLELTVPVLGEAPHPDTTVRAELSAMPMPQERSTWQVTARHAGRAIQLHISGNVLPPQPYFFSERELIQYDQPQSVAAGASELTLTLPLADDAEETPTRLTGVLGYTDAGAYHGTRIDVPVMGGAATRPSALPGRAATGLSAGALLIAALGGLILNLMPCVFPVLGIKIAGFASEAGSTLQRTRMHALAFACGVIVSFWVLASIIAFLRVGGRELGWGFQLQSAPFVFAICVVVLVFGLCLSGVFEFGVRVTGLGSNWRTTRGLTGSFLAGVLATVVATPCSAPLLAPMLGVALALPAAQSLLLFTCIAIGMSAPYLLLAAFPQGVRLLPRPGRWLQTFRQAMAFPLYATLGYLIWVLAAEVGEPELLSALLGLTIVAMAVWLYGRAVGPERARRSARLARASALVLLIAGVQTGWPHTSRGGDLLWETWSPEYVTRLREQGRAVYVDFTARWCATCQANKTVVFVSSDVKRVIRDRHVALLKADWTTGDARITAELARWGRAAVPFNLAYVPGRPEPQILPEILTPAVVIEAMQGDLR